MVLGYWKSVLADAWLHASRAYKVDTRENIVFLVIGLILAYLIFGWTTDDWLSALATPGRVFLTLVSGIGIWFLINLFIAPARMAAAAQAKVADLEHQLNALISTRHVSLRDARGLMFRLYQECHKVRMANKGRSAGPFIAIAQQVLVDVKVLLGLEAAAKLENDFGPVFGEGVLLPVREDVFKKFEFRLKEMSDTLEESVISDEPNVFDYVQSRLAELRPVKDA